jgi:hypothetical protein
MSAAIQVAYLGLLLRAGSAVAWVVSIDDASHGTDGASVVTVDTAGDVVAAGVTHSPNPAGDFDGLVVKLSGSTGAEKWRRVFPSGGISTVKVDAAGDVIAGGGISYVGAAVFKLSGTTGTEEWRYVLPDGGGGLNAVTVDTGGDIVAAGTMTSHLPALNTSFVVVKLAGTDGLERWRRQLPPSPAFPFDGARAVAVDVDGNVEAVGSTLRQSSSPAFTPHRSSPSSSLRRSQAKPFGAGRFEAVPVVVMEVKATPSPSIRRGTS